MSDLTAEQVNTYTATDGVINAPIFVNASGSVHLDLNALTGDSLDGANLNTVNLAEALIKLGRTMSLAAVSTYEGNNLIDARNTYPSITTQIITDTNGDRFNRYTASTNAKSPLNFDDVVAL